MILEDDGYMYVYENIFSLIMSEVKNMYFQNLVNNIDNLNVHLCHLVQGQVEINITCSDTMVSWDFISKPVNEDYVSCWVGTQLIEITS